MWHSGTVKPTTAWHPTIPSGTDIPVTLDENIPVTRDHIGDTFQGHITRDVEVDGRVALVADTPVEVKLVEQSGGSKAATLRLVNVNVNGDTRRVQADVARADTDERGLSTAKKTGVGAAAGAIVGAVTGVGVLKGAVVGAGGGLAWGLLDGKETQGEGRHAAPVLAGAGSEHRLTLRTRASHPERSEGGMPGSMPPSLRSG